MIKKRNKAILCAIASFAMVNSTVAGPVSVMASEKIIESRATVTKMEVYNTDSLNIRKGASTKYAILGTASRGQVLEVVSISNGWAKINYKNGIGYCSASYLKKVTTTTPTPAIKQMIVKVDDLSVRKGAGTSYTKLGSLKKGTKVNVVSELSSGWVKIEFNGGYGYVSNVKGAYLEAVSNPSTPSEPSVPSTPEGSTTQYSATADINLRKTASWSGEIITVIKKGAVVEFVSNNNGWTKVNYNGNTGYVPSTHITKVESSTPSVPSVPEVPNKPEEPSQPEAPSTENGREMTAKVDSLSVRAGSSTSHTKLGELKKGEVVIALETLSNGWVKIVYKSQIAYVSNVKGAYLQEGPYVKDRESANKVIDLIKSIDKNITLGDKEEVIAVRKAYDSLNSSAKSLVTNVSTLVNAEAKIVELEKEQTDIETSNEVISIIEEIEALSGVIELGNKELISRARMAYNNLSPEAKALVSVETLKILEDAEAEIAKLEKEENDKESAKIVQEKIELLSRDITLVDQEVVASTRAEFEKLSPEAKALVANISILQSAEGKIAEKKEKYSEVMNLIGDIPTIVTLDHKTQVEEAREAFDNLEQDIQDYITTTAQEHYQILTRAEETIQRLEEAQEENAETLLQSIQERLDELMGRDVTLDDKETVIQIRKDYDSLPSNLQNGMIATLIEEFEMQIGWLEKVKSIQDRIDALSARELELADKDAVVQIRNDYNSLPYEFKAKISEEDIKELELEVEGLEYAAGRLDDFRKKEYEQKTANAVIEKISLIPEEIVITDYLTILNARQAYDKLYPEAKLLVTNFDVLEEAEATITIKKERYDRAMFLIGELPDDITLEHEAQIIEARAAFEVLTDDEKEHVLNFKEHYQLLTRAEEALQRLKDGIQ